MPTYSLTAVNVGSFALGESDKVLTLFSAERGLTKAVAKGVRKPGAKLAGRAEPLCVNYLILNTGRSLDIITQADGIESFAPLRKDLVRLAYGLYYAELTAQFGPGLEEDSAHYFGVLCEALRDQASSEEDPPLLCLKFEMYLLELLGYRPELSFCVECRRSISDYNVSSFDFDSGGVVCNSCHEKLQRLKVKERSEVDSESHHERTFRTHLTPLVWQRLVLSSIASEQPRKPRSLEAAERATAAARRLVQKYIEHRAGRRMKSLDLIPNF